MQWSALSEAAGISNFLEAVRRPAASRARAVVWLDRRALREFQALPLLLEGEDLIVPTEKPKKYLQKLICAEECFHFSDVGCRKTKVIRLRAARPFSPRMPKSTLALRWATRPSRYSASVCPSTWCATRWHRSRALPESGLPLGVLQLRRLSALVHPGVQLGGSPALERSRSAAGGSSGTLMKQIFIPAFNSFKKS